MARRILMIRRLMRPTINIIRRFNEESEGTTSGSCGPDYEDPVGLVLGVYVKDDEEGVALRLTPAAEKFNDRTCGKLLEQLKYAGKPPKLGEARLFYGLDTDFGIVALVGLGGECDSYNKSEGMDMGKEHIRIAAAVGARALQKNSVSKLYVESFNNAESAAEGAALGIWRYQELREQSKQVVIPFLDLHDDCDYTGWQIGLHKAAAQNLARQLADTPANLLTPTAFAQHAVETLCKSGVNVEVKVRGWAETQHMGAFLAVAKGSCEPPVFLELSYYGAAYDERPVVMVGSGITFDSGGEGLKTCRDMLYMKGDVSGAAVVVAATRALALLRLPINIRSLIPLCENMPGCSAFKPGDIVTAMNGKSIRVEQTCCEGRLILADALFYAQNFWPKLILDVGTLTKDIKASLGGACSGVFTNSDNLWKRMYYASVHTGDRVWRMPLWHFFTRQVTESSSTDMKNVGRGPGGGACKAAAFLREFVPCGDWIHMDTFGVMKENGKDHPYLQSGMSGRPTRTVIEFVSQLTCKPCP